jgi:WD40 repeat protein
LKRAHLTIPFLCLVLALVTLAVPVVGQPINEDYKLLPADGDTGDQFGRPVAVDDGIIVIGARYDEPSGNKSGAVYLFDAVTGAEITKLTASDGAADDWFGHSVAIDNGIIAVGAIGDSEDGTKSGSVYLFDAITFAEIRKIRPSDGRSQKVFGYDVALDDGVLAVSATGDSDNGDYSGSAYLFNVLTGDQLWKLLADDGAYLDNFGMSIDIGDGVVAVGAHNDDDNGSNSGSAYLFDVTTGTQTAKLTPDDGRGSSHFGWSIALDGGLVAVGAPNDINDRGAVYLFDVATENQVTKLWPGDFTSDGEFGISLAMDGGIVAVVMQGDEVNDRNSGSGYLFNATTHDEIAKFLPSDGGQNHYFGVAITIQGLVVIVGADAHDQNGFGAGAAYLFNVDQTLPTEQKSMGSFKSMFR